MSYLTESICIYDNLSCQLYPSSSRTRSYPNRRLDDIQAFPHLGTHVLDPRGFEHLVHAQRTRELKAHWPRLHQGPRCAELGVELGSEHPRLKALTYIVHAYCAREGLSGGGLRDEGGLALTEADEQQGEHDLDRALSRLLHDAPSEKRVPVKRAEAVECDGQAVQRRHVRLGRLGVDKLVPSTVPVSELWTWAGSKQWASKSRGREIRDRQARILRAQEASWDDAYEDADERPHAIPQPPSRPITDDNLGSWGSGSD